MSRNIVVQKSGRAPFYTLQVLRHSEMIIPMPNNPRFVHVAPRLSPELLAHLTLRQSREGLRSLASAVRAELTDHLAKGGPFGPVLAPSASSKRQELWLPRELMAQVRALAVEHDASASNMLTTILGAGVHPGLSSAGHAAVKEDPQAVRAQPPPVAA